jgi:hypothetical protein
MADFATGARQPATGAAAEMNSRGAAAQRPEQGLNQSDRNLAALLVAFVALPGLGDGPGVLLHVLPERPPDIVDLVEPALLVAPDKALIALVRFDQFAFSSHGDSPR